MRECERPLEAKEHEHANGNYHFLWESKCTAPLAESVALGADIAYWHWKVSTRKRHWPCKASSTWRQCSHYAAVAAATNGRWQSIQMVIQWLVSSHWEGANNNRWHSPLNNHQKKVSKYLKPAFRNVAQWRECIIKRVYWWMFSRLSILLAIVAWRPLLVIKYFARS